MRKLINDVASLVRDLNTMNKQFHVCSDTFQLGQEDDKKFLKFELWNHEFRSWQELKLVFEELGYEVAEFEVVYHHDSVRIKIYDHT